MPVGLQQLYEGPRTQPGPPSPCVVVVGAAEHGDLVAQHEELDVLG
jgi:hypothetical protein